MEAHVDNSDVRLDIPSHPGYLALARRVVSSVAAMLPTLDEARVADVRLVVSEMCTNAMEANWRSAARKLGVSAPAWGRGTGGLPAPDVLSVAEDVHIACRRVGDSLEIIVRDHGQGFAPQDGDPHPPAHDPARLDHERGLGIPLVQYLADDVEFDWTSKGTTVTALVRPRV